MSDLPSHIGLNAVFIAPNMGGLDTYTRGLVPELVRAVPGVRFSIFCSPEGRDHLAAQPWAGEVELVTHPLLGRRGLKAASELTVLGALAPRRGVQLLNSLALTGPIRTRAVHVVTLADLTWMVVERSDAMATYRLWRAIVPPVARRADRIIAISEAGRRDILSRLGIPAERIDITYPGFGRDADGPPTPERELRERFGLRDGPVVLDVSTKHPHKNLALLVRALPALVARHPDVRLVIPGNPTSYEDELRALAARLGVAEHLVLPPFVSADDLEGLYAAAACFAFPSTHEGFGLPVLEAMARGVPVVCSNAGPLPEAGGDAARYFDPHDEAAAAAAILAVLDDPGEAQRMAAAGREHASRFTWQRCAEQTLESYTRAWAGRGR